MASFKDENFGFIGIGAMGGPMVQNLANKLPVGTHVFVYDVVEHAVDEVCSKQPGRLIKARNSKEVAEKCVSMRPCFG